MRSNIFIIAEAGVNHNGDIKLAKELIDAAYESGANAVKFQTFTAQEITTKKAKKANYQKFLDNSENQYEMLKKLELKFEDYYELLEYCNKKSITFMSTGFDLVSNTFLRKLGLKIFKIPSGEITNFPYLKQIGSFKKSIIISTGVSTLGEIEKALQTLIDAGSSKDKITVLHCNSEYPTPMKDVNLNAMLTIKKAFDLKIGYSDHTEGIEVAIAAATLGASIIEKHLTLDRRMEGPDHLSSIEPQEFKKMTRSIRNIEIALGSQIKQPTQSEIKNRDIIRKSIIASKKINKGEKFTYKNLTTKRPGNGISPMLYEDIIGKFASQDFYPDDFIIL